MSDSIFKKYLESLVENKEDVVVPEVKNVFASEVDVEEEILEKVEVKKEDTHAKIDEIIKRMLPANHGKVEEEVLEKYEEEREIEPVEEIKREIRVNPSPNPLQKKTISLLDNKAIQAEFEKKKLDGVEYEEYDPSKIRFMKELPRFEMKNKDHSSIIIAKDCLRKYFFSSVVCLTPAEDTNIFYPWGTAYHIYRQKLNEIYGYGDHEPKSLDLVLAKRAHKEAARQGIEYWMKNGEDQKPGSKFDFFTTERLYQSFVKAFEHWMTEKKKGQIKIIAVEQFFVVELMDGRFIQGRTDEVVIYNNELWGRDYKTTQKPEHWFVAGLKPNNQAKTYTFGTGKLAGKKARGIIIQTMYNAKGTKQGAKGPLVYEKIVEVSDYDLKSWEEEQAHWNRILQLCREHDIWPMSENNCQYCDYQQVCIQPTEAAMMNRLESKFKLRLRNPAQVD